MKEVFCYSVFFSLGHLLFHGHPDTGKTNWCTKLVISLFLFSLWNAPATPLDAHVTNLGLFFYSGLSLVLSAHDKAISIFNGFYLLHRSPGNPFSPSKWQCPCLQLFFQLPKWTSHLRLWLLIYFIIISIYLVISKETHISIEDYVMKSETNVN